MEVVNHNLGFQPYGVVMAFHIPPELLLRLLGIEFRIILYCFDQFVIAFDRGVAFEHIEDKAFLNRLLHAVAVKGKMLHFAVRAGKGLSEHLEGLILGRDRKGEVAGVGQHLAGIHPPLKRIVHRVFRVVQDLAHGCGGLPALAGMGLINEDGKGSSPMPFRDLVEDLRKLLDRADDDLLPTFDKFSQIFGVLGMSDGCADLCILPDGVFNLIIQDTAVRDNDDRFKDRLAVFADIDELMCKPCNGVGFPASGGMLNKVTPARSVPGHIRE